MNGNGGGRYSACRHIDVSVTAKWLGTGERGGEEVVRCHIAAALHRRPVGSGDGNVVDRNRERAGGLDATGVSCDDQDTVGLRLLEEQGAGHIQAASAAAGEDDRVPDGNDDAVGRLKFRLQVPITGSGG